MYRRFRTDQNMRVLKWLWKAVCVDVCCMSQLFTYMNYPLVWICYIYCLINFWNSSQWKCLELRLKCGWTINMHSKYRDFIISSLVALKSLSYFAGFSFDLFEEWLWFSCRSNLGYYYLEHSACNQTVNLIFCAYRS